MMSYSLYDCANGNKFISQQNSLIAIIKELRKSINLTSKNILYMIVEDDGKSQFPIIGIYNLQDYYNLLEQYAEELTKQRKSDKIKKR